MSQGDVRKVKHSDYAFTWGAILINDGWASDDAVVIDQNADDVAYEVGIGGETTIMQLSDDSAIVTVRLQEGASGNAALAAYRALARAGAAPIAAPCLIKTTGSFYAGAKCLLLSQPKQRKLSASVQVKEWRFFVAKLVPVDGTIAAE